MNQARARSFGRQWRERVLPAVLAAGSIVLCVGALTVQSLAGGELIDNYLIVDATLGIAGSTLGALLIARLPANPMGWLFGLSGTAYSMTAAVAAWSTGAQSFGWPGSPVAAWLSEWTYWLGLGLQTSFLLLLFPDGRPPSPRWRPVAWASGVVLALTIVAMMLAPEVHPSEHEAIPNPIGGTPFAEAAIGPLLVIGGVLTIASVASLLIRVRRGGPEERRRIAPYVAAAIVVVAALAAARMVPGYEPIIQALILPLMPASATLCILRFRLYDLEVVVRRSLVWVGLTAVVVIGYALVVEATANLLRREAGFAESLIGAGAVAAVFQPTRLWIQRTVSRKLYGLRETPELALVELGQTLAVTADPADALHRATERIQESLATPWVAVAVDRDTGGPHLTETSTRPGWVDEGTVTRVPLVHGGLRQGSLLVSRRTPNEALSRRDVRLLEGFSYQVAATAAAFRLTDDLRRSRERVVIAREEERRRLRHDLHDELGPLLASFTIQLDAAYLRQERTGLAPVELLDDLRASAHDAIATVRRAVEHLRPPALDELGLVPAIDARVQGLTTSEGPRIDVGAAGPLPALPAAVEVAAHRIAVEAVTNAIRHADARSVCVLLEMIGETALRVQVRDDGRGVAPDRSPGVGTTSMRRRAEELGGRCEITRGESGGTVVSALLPVAGGR